MADEHEGPAEDEPQEAAEADEAPEEPERFSRWNWWLIVLPIVAVLDLIIVLMYGANMLAVTDIHPDAELIHVVLVGLAVFVVLLIVEGILLAGGHPENLEDDQEPAPGPETPAARQDLPAEEPTGDSPLLEAVETDDEVEGRRVIELARPPKTGVDAGVYSTTYVEIDRERVLRVEELVAERTA